MSPTSVIVAPFEVLAGGDTLTPAGSQPRPLPRRILLLAAVLSKPFAPRQLVQTVKEVLQIASC